jgi:hypothetical protein
MGFSTWDFPTLGELWMDSGTLHFDTDALTIHGDVMNALQADCSLSQQTTQSCAVQGSLSRTREESTEVAIFNFDSFFLGEGVNLTVSGQRALAILSRSSIIMDTALRCPPGEIGGFPGGFEVSGHSHNGPGSANTRVHEINVETSGADINEIQTITTTCQDGQTLGGTFRVAYKGEKSSPIRWNAEPDELKRILRQDLSQIGTIKVTYSQNVQSNGGRQWQVEFLSAWGNVPQLTVINNLTGLSNNVASTTFRHGNELGGTFSLTLGPTTSRAIPHDVSDVDFQNIMLEDFDFLYFVEIKRSEPLNGHLQVPA